MPPLTEREPAYLSYAVRSPKKYVPQLYFPNVGRPAYRAGVLEGASAPFITVAALNSRSTHHSMVQ
jgi:hypothetical protein